MFARTERLMLRPAWAEDAAALTAAIAHAPVARMLSRVPYPYTLADAQAWIAAPRGAEEPRFVIESLEDGAPVLIGGIALIGGSAAPELGYWLTPSAWGRGYATEAGRAVVDMARHALPVTQLAARHFADNPASGRVLRKLGFRPTGTVSETRSAARPEPATMIDYTLDVDVDRTDMPIAA
jgi:RimJ/RimL family protein N-acetyltransferase